jgi:hypothetical protein
MRQVVMCRGREELVPVQGGNGCEDGIEKLMASSPEIANWELPGTLVEPETNVWVNCATRTSDYLQEGKKPTLVVENSEVAR